MNTEPTRIKPKLTLKRSWRIARRRIFKMVSVGVVDDRVNQLYDVLSTLALVLNLAVAIMDTFDNLHATYGSEFDIIEAVTVAFFAADYLLRLLTAKLLYPECTEKRALIKYIFSFAGIIDLLSFLPYYLPFVFPGGAVVFRLIRVVRIMRLFRVNAYYDSLNVITEVIVSKKQQLLASMFIIFVLMLASSLAMYSLEHEAQPTVFANAFSGIWWSASTLLTVGYGDIYPITPAGQFLGIIITFLGVGMVAIPTGIISAGFVEQYTRLKRLGDYAKEEDIHFIELELKANDGWVGRQIKDLGIPKGAIVAVILRGREKIIPRGDSELKSGDTLVIGAEPHKSLRPVHFKEITLGPEHPWNGTMIRDLDISRQTLIVMVRRHHKTRIPRSEMILTEGDTVFLYSEHDKNSVSEGFDE